MPDKWTLHDVLNTHRSEPHNPAIATAFFRAGIIESWGRGITSIKNACKTAGKPAPIFEFKRDREFSVTFFTRDNFANISTERFANDDVAKDPIKDLLNSIQQELVLILATSPHLTIKELSEKLKINERNARKNIKVLKGMGIIEHIGSKKSGSWLVKS